MITEEEWSNPGAVCPSCKREAFRVSAGLCTMCWSSKNEKYYRDKRKKDKFLKFMKSHNARIKKHSSH